MLTINIVDKKNFIKDFDANFNPNTKNDNFVNRYFLNVIRVS